MNAKNEKPVRRFKRGGVEAAVWKKRINDRPAFSVQVSKRYRDGEEYKSTQVFLGGDLVGLARVSELADAWIHEQIEQEREVDVPAS